MNNAKVGKKVKRGILSKLRAGLPETLEAIKVNQFSR
jgi:hypothetical protein